MSGKKGMKKYSEQLKEEIRRRAAEGASQKELSREYGVSKYSVQSWCGKRPETRLRQLAPLPQGRPKKQKTIDDYKKENLRLKKENELLRDFLSLTGRK